MVSHPIPAQVVPAVQVHPNRILILKILHPIRFTKMMIDEKYGKTENLHLKGTFEAFCFLFLKMKFKKVKTKSELFSVLGK